MSRPYRLVWLAYFLSGAGDWISRLAVPVILYHLTGSALYMSLAYAMTYLPFLLVTPVGGVFADAFDRRSLLVVSDGVAALLVMLLALVATRLHGNLWLFYPVLFLIFSLAAVYHPIFQSYIPTLVPEAAWARGNAYISAADNLTDVLGPVAGGLIIVSLGAPNALWLDAGSFLVSASCLYFAGREKIIIRPRRAATARTLFRDLRIGVRYVFGDRILRYCCLLFTLTNLGLTVFTSNLMFFLLSRVGLDSLGAGIVLGFAGGGAIAGSLAAPLAARHVGDGVLIVTATVLSGLGVLSLLWINQPFLVASIWGAVLATNSLVVVTFFTLRQRIVPADMLGRAVATSRFVSFLAVPIGSVLGGWLAERYGSMDLPILLSGVLVTMSGFIGMLMPLNRRAACGEASA